MNVWHIHIKEHSTLIKIRVRTLIQKVNALLDKSGKVASLKRKSSLGSTPRQGTKFYAWMTEWPNVTDCKPVFREFESHSMFQFYPWVKRGRRAALRIELVMCSATDTSGAKLCISSVMAASRIPNPLGQGSSPWGYASFRMLSANNFNFNPNQWSGSIPASSVMVAHRSISKKAFCYFMRG
jgi:hypothetical protein